MIHVIAALILAASVKVDGTLIDPAPVLRRVLAPYASLEPEQVAKKLQALGYRLVRMDRKGDEVVFVLEPLDVIRHVFIKGNWPLFESDVKRHVFIREGTRLPPRGPQRDKLLEDQRRRIETYLHHEGYFDAKVSFRFRREGRNEVDLYVILDKGDLYRLGRLVVKGNHAVPTEKIRSFFVHKILFYELPFYKKRFQKDIKRLIAYYKKLGYYQVRIRHDFGTSSLDRKRKRVDITLFIREGKKVDIEFLGKRKLSRDRLMELLTFRETGSFDRAELRRSAEAIVHELQKKGYYNAVVFPESYPGGRGKVRILFTIHPGREMRVKRILFPGARHFASSKLRAVVATRVYPRVLGKVGLGSGGYVTPLQARQDARKITGLYRDNGFVDAAVSWRVRYEGNEDEFLASLALDSTLESGGRRSIVVAFVVREGRRVVVRSMEVQGWRVPGRVARQLNLRAGAPFSKEKYEQDLKILQRALADAGHPYATIEGTLAASEDRSGVVVTYRVDPGPRVRFGDILIRGAFKTRKSLILKEITFRPGRPFSLHDAEASMRNLRSLGVFRSVRIRFLDAPSKRTDLPAVVDVVERYDDHGQVEMGVGFSTDNLFFVSGAYKNRNVFGLAKRVEAKGELGSEIKSGRLVYQDPRFLGTRYLFDVTTYYRLEETVRFGGIETYGMSTTVQSQWGWRFRWYGRYEIRKVSYREDLIRVASGGDESDRINFSTITGSLGGGVVWDHRNNQLIPSRGWRLALSGRVASRWLGGDDDFVHLRAWLQYFVPLPWGIIYAQGVRYDHGIPFGSTYALPKVERFYAGGDTTVRGYEEDSLVTVVDWVEVAPGASVYRVRPLGGDIRLISNSELLFPLIRDAVAGLPLWGVLFFDTGYILNSYAGFGPDVFRSSYGVALRLATPVGFLSLAYGIPLNPSWGTDPDGRIHFNFGLIY